jgi:hypothetical protein
MAMNRLFFSFIFFAFPFSLVAQENYSISKPELSLSNDILTIKYDLTGCGANETISIKLIVLNSMGDTIKATYVTGDIGNNIRCGISKLITWNFEKEKIFITDDINIILKGEKQPQANSTLPQSNQNNYKRGNIVFSSILFPGMGQSKASGKKCYLIFSGIAYGTLGLSVYYSTQAQQHNEKYHSGTGSDRDMYFAKWENCYDKSLYFAFCAAGIWVPNITWSAVMPIKVNNKKLSFNLYTPAKNQICLGAA